MTSFFSIEQIRRNSYYTMKTDHFHETYEIYYLVSGERLYFIKNRTYLIRPGELVLIPKYEVHKTLDATTKGHERILIDFHEKMLDSISPVDKELLLVPFRRKSNILKPGEQQRQEMMHLFRSMMAEYQQPKMGQKLVLNSLLVQLLILMGRLQGEENELKQEIEEETTTQRKIREVVEYINISYAQPVMLSEVAERFEMSPYHLSRTFKQMTGFSFVHYIQMIRLREAQRLLRETPMKVIEVAILSGYDNVTHFNRVFKNFTGTTPTDYRKRMRIE
jgi:AraC-like DNA-binding protein